MFESYTKTIKECLGYIAEYFNEDNQKKKEMYLEKLEHLLDLIVKLLSQYENTPIIFKDLPIIFEDLKIDSQKTQYFRITLKIEDTSTYYWYADNAKNDNGMENKEFARLCWEKNVKVDDFMNRIFNKIQTIIELKKTKIKQKQNKYRNDLNNIDFATQEMKKLIEINIDEQIKNIENDR